MKLHRGTCEAVVTTLESIFSGNRYADKAIEKVLKSNPKWGARDRRFIAETTYDIVRWFRLLVTITDRPVGEDNYWALLGAWLALNGYELPRWDEFEGIHREKLREKSDKVSTIRKIRESIPDWLDEAGERELGSRWERELKALNQEAPVVLRVNTLKSDKRTLQRTLETEGVKTSPLVDYPDALVLEERQNVFGTASFKEGSFEVQDAASQLIAPFLRIEPGMRVIDACAGAGGKTLHLAALMKNKGRIIAMDVEEYKLQELQKRARRAGVTNMETRVIENSKSVKRLADTADRLLLDVPCSGLGVLKRNPDAKWKLSPEFLDNVRQLQQHILRDYWTMVKPGGLIVYSTCSILPSENEAQVKAFVGEHAGKVELVDSAHRYPSDGFDGFYMALLKRVS